MHDDTRDYLSLFLRDTPLLDVRAPGEFTRGAFPGATNLPLLDDEQRHLIGIRYKEQGQDAAIALGHELVSGETRQARTEAWRDWCRRHPDGYLYCFRGGLRSRTVQQWLADEGVQQPLVLGGFKAMRRFLLENFERLVPRSALLVLAGRTGVAKTRVIHRIAHSIDLEGLAHHRGSAFGRRPGGQPAQIDFENRLAIAWLRHHHTRENVPLVIEDESRLIGRCHVPVVLQQKLKEAPRVVIEETLESRAAVTLEDYVLEPLAEYGEWFGKDQALARLGEELHAALGRIRRRLGGARHGELDALLADALAEQARSGDSSHHLAWITPLLRDYYDPMYDYMLQQHRGPVLYQGDRQAVLEYLSAQTDGRS